MNFFSNIPDKTDAPETEKNFIVNDHSFKFKPVSETDILKIITSLKPPKRGGIRQVGTYFL